MNTYSQMSLGFKIRETPASLKQAEVVNQGSTSMILPELLDKIHSDFVATCSDGMKKKFNGRLERALERAKLGNVSVTQKPGVLHVRGVTGPRAFYVVDLNEKTCECPDHANGNVCYHRVASWYIQQALFQTAEDEPAVVDDEVAREVVEALNPSPDVFIWGEYLYEDGSSIPVEIVELDTEKLTAFVRALPVSDDGQLSPVFPFPSPFEGSSVRYSSTSCAFDELISVKIYRYKENSNA